MFFENYRFSRFFCKRSNKIQGPTMQSLKTLKPSESTWPLRKQPSFSWMLLVRLQKRNWRIVCFQKLLRVDNVLPSEPCSSSRTVIPARTIAKWFKRSIKSLRHCPHLSGYFGKRIFFFLRFQKQKTHPRVTLKFESFLSVPRSKTLKRNLDPSAYAIWHLAVMRRRALGSRLAKTLELP